MSWFWRDVLRDQSHTPWLQGMDIQNLPEPIYVFMKSFPPAGTPLSVEKRAAMINVFAGLIQFYYSE